MKSAASSSRRISAFLGASFLPSSAGSAPQPPFATLGPVVDDPPGAVEDRCLSRADADVIMDVRVPEGSNRVHHVRLVHGNRAAIGQFRNERRQAVRLLSRAALLPESRAEPVELIAHLFGRR